MEKKVEAFIQARKLLHHGATILVGVSGGPDSMALLHILSGLRRKWELRLIVLTIDHGLRGEESQADTHYVKSICKEWQIECIETFLDVPSYKEKNKAGTQLAARELRYAFFKEKMAEFKADYLALGHHGDDQTETILMQLTRNVSSSVTGMQPKRDLGEGSLIRPLLSVSKQEIEAYLQEKGIDPRRDPSNAEDSYTRNYFRIHVIPHLKAKNPNLNQHMQKLSEIWLEDEAYLKTEAEKVIGTAVFLEKNPKKAVIQIDALISFPFALQRRAFHLILRYLYQEIPDGIGFIHEEQFFDLLCNPNPNASLDFPAGLMLIKAYQELIIQFPQPQSAPFYCQLQVPGQVVLPDGSTIRSSIEHSLTDESKNTFLFHADEPELPLFVRSRRPGDRMKIKGMQGSKKLKDIFIDEKIPRSERDKWPVVTDASDRIIWLAGLKKGIRESNEKAVVLIKLQYSKNGYI